MELPVQSFLRAHGEQDGLQLLNSKYKVKVHRHKTHPNLIALKYGSRAPKSDIPNCCRGIILDTKENFKCVSFGFNRFFNVHERCSAKVDWNNCTAFEKLDGSLMVMYHYAGKWHVGTSSIPDGTNRSGSGESYASLFWSTFHHLKYELPKDTSHCYTFELLHPENRIITEVKEPNLVLLGCRDLSTLREVNVLSTAKTLGWKSPQTYMFSSLEEVLQAARAVNPGLQEGFVVCDQAFNRVKIKSPTYVALALVGSGTLLGSNKGIRLTDASLRGLLAVLQKAETDEFVAHFPQLKKVYHLVEVAFNEMLRTLERGQGVLGQEFRASGRDLYDFVAAQNPHDLVPVLLQTHAWAAIRPFYVPSKNSGRAAGPKPKAAPAPPPKVEVKTTKRSKRRRRRKKRAPPAKQTLVVPCVDDDISSVCSEELSTGPVRFPRKKKKTRPMCRNWLRTGSCRFGRRCRYSHHQPETQV